MVKPDLAATIDRSVFPGVQGGPLMHVIAAKAVGVPVQPHRGVPARTSSARSTTPQVLAETLAQQGVRLV